MLGVISVSVLVFAYLVSQFTPVFNIRYTVVSAPPFALLLAIILNRIGEQKLVPILMLAVLVLAGVQRVTFLRAESLRDDRRAAEYLTRNYREGDEIVSITLNFAPITHYLRALSPDRTFSQTVFPEEIAGHIGWRDRDGMVQDSTRIRREAADIARKLGDRSGHGRIWLLAVLPDENRPELAPDSIFTGILLKALEADFQLEQTVALPGWWHREIQVFQHR